MARVNMVTSHVEQWALTVQDCALCGVVFALTPEFIEARRQSGTNFYCPNGHVMVYPRGESADEREKRELRRRAEHAEREAQTQREARQWAESRAKGANIQAGKARAAKQRLEHRIQCGVCPHCQRTFKQLAAHMQSKHVAPPGKGTP